MMIGALVVSLGAFHLAMPPSKLAIRGADISFTLQQEAIGQTFSDQGQTAPLEKILAGHGANYARLRVWVDPPAGTSDLPSALTLARRAHDAGLQILLDLHYSDTWADRTAQQTPKAWQGQNPEALRRTVETYTREVLAAFARQGTPVSILQIGNETTLGMLWPSGQIYKQSGEDWTGYAELVKAGIKGAKTGNLSKSPQIMIHTDTGGDRHASVYHFDQLRQQGVNFDLIGLSYYPFWHGPLEGLRQNLQELASRYGRDILIVETAYPWTLSTGSSTQSVVSGLDSLPEAQRYPPTPEGQAEYYKALNQILREVPGGHGAGYLIWEPGWRTGVPAGPDTGNGHSNLTLFDRSGQGLPALDAFQPAGTAPKG